jgi:hypothetical protein
MDITLTGLTSRLVEQAGHFTDWLFLFSVICRSALQHKDGHHTEWLFLVSTTLLFGLLPFLNVQLCGTRMGITSTGLTRHLCHAGRLIARPSLEIYGTSNAISQVLRPQGTGLCCAITTLSGAETGTYTSVHIHHLSIHESTVLNDACKQSEVSQNRSQNYFTALSICS